MPSRDDLMQAIAALEAQRGVIEDSVIETSIVALRRQIAMLDEPQPADRITGATLLHAVISSNHVSTDTTATGRILSSLYALQVRLKMVATEFGGTLDPMSGYDVIAHFTSPEAKTSAEQAIQAALEMLKILHAHNAQHTARDMAPFRVRIGIHTSAESSPESAGASTSQNPHSWITKALQQAAPANGILISYPTYVLTRGTFAVHHFRSVEVEQIGETIRAYQVARMKMPLQLVPLDQIHGVSTRLIGRSEELRLLQDLTGRVFTERTAQVYSVIGDTGLGKSRLIHEFITWLDLIAEQVWCFSGRATPGLQYQPYGLFREILNRGFFIDRSASLAEIRDGFIQGLLAQLGETNIHKAESICHLVGVGFSADSQVAGGYQDPGQLRSRAFAGFAHYIQAVIEQTGYPVVMVLEDIQWADSGTLDLLHYLAVECRALPLLIITTAHSGFWQRHPGWGADLPDFYRMELAPLSDQATGLMVAEILRNVPSIPRRLQEDIVHQAAGNPCYVWQVVRLLVQVGAVIPNASQWQIIPECLPDLAALSTLHDVGCARLAQLSQIELDVLQRAAVIGDGFWDRAVMELVADTNQMAVPVSDTLRALTSQHFVAVQSDSAFYDTTEYQFNHVYFRDLVYEQMSPHWQQLYHGRAATWLIGHGVDRIGQYAGLIAHHYHRAGETRRAIKWYRMAGTQAQYSFVAPVAIHHFRQALDLIPHDPASLVEHLAILHGLGQALVVQLHYEDAIEVYETLIEVAQNAQNFLDRARAWNALALIYHSHKADSQAGLAAAIEAERLCKEASTPEMAGELAAAWLHQSRWWLEAGDNERAALLATDSLDLATRYDNKSGMTETFNVLGMIAATLGNFEAAASFFNQALKFCQEIGDRWHEAKISNNLAELARQRGDYQTALKMYEAAEQIASEIGNRRSKLIATVNAAAAWIGLGDYKTALRRLQAVLPAIESSGFQRLYASACDLVAEAQLGLGQVERGLSSAQKALQLAQELELPAGLGRAWNVLGMALRKTQTALLIGGKEYTPGACFETALNIVTAADIESEQATVLYTWACDELEYGDYETGKRLWLQALEHFSRIGADYQLHRMKSARPSLRGEIDGSSAL